MQVIKFGGSSVANAVNIQRVINIVANKINKTEGNKGAIIIVVSALGGITDMLLTAADEAAQGNEEYASVLKIIEERHLDTAKELLPVNNQSGVLSIIKKACNELEDICSSLFLLREGTLRTRDKIAAYGEFLSSRIIAAALNERVENCIWKDSRELIITNSEFTNAAVKYEETNELIATYFNNSDARLFLLPGFIAANASGVTTTLGRGGSDYTAAILAAALNADVLEIWTDVSGMMTADPRLVSNAKVITAISYKEAMELSHFGAKVIYPPTIAPVRLKEIPILIKNTFAPEDTGTLVKAEVPVNGNAVRGISSIKNIALLSLEGSGMIGIPGFSKRLFEALSREKINVILITQSSSEHSICVAVEAQQAARAKWAVDNTFESEIAQHKVEPLYVEDQLAIVALVGENMKSRAGISGSMFSTFGRNGVNVRAIAQGSSERNISAVVAQDDVKKAINILHEEFFEKAVKQLHVFIAGTGNVGSKLINQLAQQNELLEKQHQLRIKVVGLCNSRNMLVAEKGIELTNWDVSLKEAEEADLSEFINAAILTNLRNTIFIDISASELVAATYNRLLEKSISVVACNKIAAAGKYAYYTELKYLARKHQCKFLFETNVGAALPVIGTLNDLLRSGDRISRIEAVLSGTLNFVFNNYDGKKPFAEVVKQAQDEGYTEPDPRLDLSGTDVMRKIMILAREAGEVMELEEVGNKAFMPQSCMTGSVDDFYKAMLLEEAHFKQLLEEAVNAGAKLKFVATYLVDETGKGHAAVGLKHVQPHEDLYNLQGKDNIVLFNTSRYADQPLIIKGAGAGAEVTASGVFADLLRAGL